MGTAVINFHNKSINFQCMIIFHAFKYYYNERNTSTYVMCVRNLMYRLLYKGVLVLAPISDVCLVPIRQLYLQSVS